MNVDFFNFSKRSNSTAQPAASGATTLPCELKEQTSMIAPTLVIKAVPVAWSPIWNYAQISTFQRYYFIKDWRWMNGVWECDMVCDALASFKTEIGNLSEYVLRSSAESDGLIVDTAYITKTEVHTNLQQLPEFYVRSATAGFYVVGIIGKESTATQGAITYYQMTPAEMARLRAYLLSDTFLTDQGLVQLADFIPADATKVIYNPYQYIVSCLWFPFADTAIPAAFKTAVSTIDFGWWNTGTGFTAYRIHDTVPVYSHSEDVSMISHPQASTRGKYLNHSPFTSRILRMCPFGEVRLPDEYLTDVDKLTIQLDCDFITGEAALLLWAKTTGSSSVTKMLMTRMSAKLGVDIQLAQVGTDYFGAYTQNLSDQNYMFDNTWGQVGQLDLSSMSGAAKTGFSAGVNIGKAEMYKTAALGNYLSAKAPQLLTGGSNGSFLMFAQNNYLCNSFYLLINEDNPQLGRPLCAIKTLNTIPGYIQVRNPDVSMACFEAERLMIIAYLASGFFYE